jgi:hypothetical protein
MGTKATSLMLVVYLEGFDEKFAERAPGLTFNCLE